MLIFQSGESMKGQRAGIAVYSPPRVAPLGGSVGLAAGWSLDLTTHDSKGRAWDFDDEECRQRARNLVRRTKPLLLIGSPMCTWFSSLMGLVKLRVDEETFQENYRRAVRHLESAFELYRYEQGVTSCTSTPSRPAAGRNPA